MATVTSDLVEHASLKEVDGILSATRGFMVDGIEGDPTAIAYLALFADGVPVAGAFHPTIPGIRASERAPIVLSPSQCIVVVTYKPWRLDIQRAEPGAPPQIEIGASVQEAETNFDVNGTIITTPYKGKHLNSLGNLVEFSDIGTGTVKFEVPQLVFRYTRREKNSPQELARNYVGKVNSGFFLGDPSHTWLCARIEGSSDDGGLTYKTVYEFQRAHVDWRATVCYEDPDTGKIPNDVAPGNGKVVVEVYEEADFGALGLGV